MLSGEGIEFTVNREGKLSLEKFASFHFSPLNNRSMLMPRIPKGEKYQRKDRLKNAFAPFSEDQLRKDQPYFQPNLGFFPKEINIDGKVRRYGVYVPDGMFSKGATVVIFLESGEDARRFLEARYWKALSERYHTALLMLESDEWSNGYIEKEFDFAWEVIQREFEQRLTLDICESWIYILGFGDGAQIAVPFALTYSATFAAVAADGNCYVPPDLLETLRKLPSDGIETKRKIEIPLPGFLIDRNGQADATAEYLKETIYAKEEGLRNTYGRVYLEQERPGAYFVNEQPVAQVWLGSTECVKRMDRRDLDESMLQFVLRFARWGGFGNNHLRTRKTMEEMGIKRVFREVEGLPRYWDVYIPSCYRPGDGKRYPLVTAIHGFSCNPSYFEQTSDWNRLAEERGFFVLFPAAYPRNVGRSRFPLPGWSVWPMDEEGIDETVYFKEMLDWAEIEFPIDTKRIYAVGHSNGGRMTQRLSRVMPERFAAFAPAGALGGASADTIEPIDDQIKRPIWFTMGEYDLASPEVDEGSVARATLEMYCKANRVTPQYENWYDNGRYHTLVMYDKAHLPMVQYTIMKGCPHTYTAEMAQLVWDTFLCHFTREEDGTVKYHG